MSDTDPQVEFIDPEDGEDVDWLEEDPLEPAASRLTLTTRGRTAFSVLALAALLMASAGTADHVYQHDQAVQQAANTLTLAQPAGALGVSLPMLGQLGVGTSWTWRPSTEVLIAVVNRGPDPVTLLPDGTLSSPSQLDGVARLDPVGAASLRPGQVGHLGGQATVACTEDDPDALLTLTIRARTADGSVAVSSLELSHPPTEGTLAEQACGAEAPRMASWAQQVTTNPRTHSFVLSMKVTSHADVPLTFDAEQQYFNIYPSGTFMGSDIAPSLPGVVLDPPVYTGDENSQAQITPGRRLTLAFTIHVAKCPSAGPVPDEGWQVQLSVQLSVDYSFATGDEYSDDLSSLIAAVCGLRN